MSTQLQPIKLWGIGGPNPPKVKMILEELGLPYEVVDIPISDIKKPDYLAINPNGRLPSIQDPNKDITLWESGAIIEYLIAEYDKEHKLSFAPGTPESYHARQWLYFQVSGQGPYYGQVGWFRYYHPERLPSAVERFAKEIRRVTGVLEAYLAEQKQKYGDVDGGPWLVGNRISYADISFITWQKSVPLVLEKDGYNDDDYPHVTAWMEKMMAREPIKLVWEHAVQYHKARTASLSEEKCSRKTE